MTRPMCQGLKIVVIMPAYNAADTLARTHAEVLAQGVVDIVIVVDDGSSDDTVRIARTLPHTKVERHERNQGYGANQKTCSCSARAFSAAARRGGMPIWRYASNRVLTLNFVLGCRPRAHVGTNKFCTES